MIMLLAAGAFALLPQQVDTTFAVRPGGTLELDVHRGSAVVDSWDRNAVRITAPGSARGQVDIRARSTGVEVTSHDPGTAVHYEITVPRSFSVDIGGVNVAVTVSGVTGAVAVSNTEGAITVRDVTGDIVVGSVSGALVIENTRGSISASTVNEGIRITQSRGSIDAGTTNGSIVMRGADADRVRASTINGLVDYDGTIQDGGHYYLGTHNGRITMSIAERANATITASTNNGQVASAFSVPVTSISNRRASIRLGSGSARVDLETFNGTVHLVRPRGR